MLLKNRVFSKPLRDGRVSCNFMSVRIAWMVKVMADSRDKQNVDLLLGHVLVQPSLLQQIEATMQNGQSMREVVEGVLVILVQRF